MTRSPLATWAAVVGLAAAGAAWWSMDRQPRRPSILLVTIDTLRADRVGAYGGEGVRTPTLDGLAAAGIRFDAAYATAPLTLPSHVSMLSGLLPVAHTVRTNDGNRVPDAVEPIASRLLTHGYRTAAFVGSMVLRKDTGIARGFEVFDDDMAGGVERRAATVVERAVAWSRSDDRRPAFLWVHVYDPHLPYDPLPPYARAGREYEGEIEYVDAALRTLVEGVESAAGDGGLAVFVAADHGEGLGDHGERSHGALLYEETIRVPLIVRLADGSRAGSVERRPVTTAGLAAAILQVAGARADRLAASILDAPSDPVVTESLYLHQQLGWSPLYAMRQGSDKAIDAPEPERYEVERDPREQRDLASAEDAATRDLITRLRRELAAASRAGVAPAAAGADAETSRQLAALGYVSGGAVATGLQPVGGVNPIDRMPVWVDVEAGLERAQANDKDAAAAIFERVLVADPGNVLAMKFLGARAIERGDLSRGIALNERVLASGLHAGDATKNLVTAYARQGAERAVAGRTAAAIDSYRRVIALDAANLDARERLGALLHRSGNRDEAREQFTFVLDRDPGRRAPALSLAILMLEAGEVEQAARRLEPLTSGWEGAAQAQAYLREARRRVESR